MTHFTVTASPLNLDLRHTFTISRWSRDTATNVYVELKAEGITGIGEAAPNARYKESQESALAFMNGFHEFKLENPYDIETFLQLMDQHADGEWSAKVALEMALLDWIGKKLHIPLYTLWNAESNTGPQTCFTIGISAPDELPSRIIEADPYPVLKVKLGTQNDTLIIDTIRRYTDKPLWIDANEGWKDVSTAKKMSGYLADQHVELIEQPMPASMLRELSELKRYSPVPIIADESFTGHESLETLAASFHGINLKIMKTGSLRRSMQWIQKARRANMKVMVGCMIESSIADTASALISLWADYADLDGHLLIKNDPFQGLKFDDRYRVMLNPQPGLGVGERL